MNHNALLEKARELLAEGGEPEEITAHVRHMQAAGSFGTPDEDREASALMHELLELAKAPRAKIPIPKSAHVDTDLPPPKSKHAHHEAEDKPAKSKRSK